MKREWLLATVIALASICFGQSKQAAGEPFTLTWTEGKCTDCKIAQDLGRIQFISRSEAWAVGYSFPPSEAQGAGDAVVVHTKDGGHTWTELRETQQHAGEADGPPAFSFLDAMRGWIAWWNPAGDPKMIHTRDGGRHWQDVSQDLLEKVLFFDEAHGVGVEATDFLRTSDSGHWTKTQIPHLRFVDRMFFLTPSIGWIAGGDGKDFFVFRTADGGRNWEESRIAAPKEVDLVRDLFFLDPNRGWLIKWHRGEMGTHLFTTVDGGRNWVPEPNSFFQGTNMWAGPVRFVSQKKGFIFEGEDAPNGRKNLIYTSDGGAHWEKRLLPNFVYDCQVFKGDLLCSAGLKQFVLLTLHPK